MHLVFDLFHPSYDFDTAHRILHDMPVLVVSLGRNNERRWFAQPAMQEQVNKEVADLHYFNGWDKFPPFYASHAQGAVPIYHNPRFARSLLSDQQEADVGSRST